MHMDVQSPDSMLSVISSTYPRTIWLCDIDDTLTDTAGMHNAAAASIEGVLSSIVGADNSRAVVGRFSEIFAILLNSHQSSAVADAQPSDELKRDYDMLLQRILACQRDIASKWGVTKKFSREVLLHLASEDCDALLTPEDLAECAGQYWRYIESHPVFFPDALRFVKLLGQIGAPLYLMTSSDGRFRLKPDGQFSYDPQESRRLKQSRIEALRHQGLTYRSIFVGDPIDKPEPAFFAAVYAGIAKNLGRPVDAEHLIVVGDSFRSDLETPMTQRDAALGILYRPGMPLAVEAGGVVRLGSFDTASDLVRRATGGAQFRGPID